MAARHSWGRFPPAPQALGALAFADGIAPSLARAEAGGLLAHGHGRSYGDSCLAASGKLLGMRGLDRFCAFDPVAGTLSAEAGVTLGEILALVVPHGWFLPVTPGTQFATLGGAIANDVHGKNHHRVGCFGRFVDEIVLHRSDRGRLVISPQAEPALFAATVGGLGLSGVIERATIRLAPITSSQLDTRTQRFSSLEQFFDLSAEHDPAHDYAVSWVDCTAQGAELGRGIYSAGNFAPDGGLALAPARRRAVPLTPPFSLINRASVTAFNSLYWHRAPARAVHRRQGFAPFFYPLDNLSGWNRLYGPAGFQQIQAVFPVASERAGIRAMLEALRDGGNGSFLAVLKRCGPLPSPGLLSFPMEGTSLAIDLANRADTGALLARLDALTADHGGRLYPAKDAHMPGAMFRAAYPAFEAVEAQRDPAILSAFWKRVMS